MSHIFRRLLRNLLSTKKDGSKLSIFGELIICALNREARSYDFYLQWTGQIFTLKRLGTDHLSTKEDQSQVSPSWKTGQKSIIFRRPAKRFVSKIKGFQDGLKVSCLKKSLQTTYINRKPVKARLYKNIGESVSIFKRQVKYLLFREEGQIKFFFFHFR